MENLWNKDVEKKFFTESVEFATPEQLFYVTEKWTTDLIQKVIEEKGLFAVKGAICEELALTGKSRADVVYKRVKLIWQILYLGVTELKQVLLELQEESIMILQSFMIANYMLIKSHQILWSLLKMLYHQRSLIRYIVNQAK